MLGARRGTHATVKVHSGALTCPLTRLSSTRSRRSARTGSKFTIMHHHRRSSLARRVVVVVALVVASADAQSFDDSYGKTINEQLAEFMARPYLMIDSMAAAIDSGELLSSSSADGAAPLGIDRERARQYVWTMKKRHPLATTGFDGVFVGYEHGGMDYYIETTDATHPNIFAHIADEAQACPEFNVTRECATYPERFALDIEPRATPRARRPAVERDVVRRRRVRAVPRQVRRQRRRLARRRGRRARARRRARSTTRASARGTTRRSRRTRRCTRRSTSSRAAASRITAARPRSRATARSSACSPSTTSSPTSRTRSSRAYGGAADRMLAYIAQDDGLLVAASVAGVSLGPSGAQIGTSRARTRRSPAPPRGSARAAGTARTTARARTSSPRCPASTRAGSSRSSSSRARGCTGTSSSSRRWRARRALRSTTTPTRTRTARRARPSARRARGRPTPPAATARAARCATSSAGATRASRATTSTPTSSPARPIRRDVPRVPRARGRARRRGRARARQGLLDGRRRGRGRRRRGGEVRGDGGGRRVRGGRRLRAASRRTRGVLAECATDGALDDALCADGAFGPLCGECESGFCASAERGCERCTGALVETLVCAAMRSPRSPRSPCGCTSAAPGAWR